MVMTDTHYEQGVLLTWMISEWIAYWKLKGDRRGDGDTESVYGHATTALQDRGIVWEGADDAREYRRQIFALVYGMYSDSTNAATSAGFPDSIASYLVYLLTAEEELV